MPRIWIADTSTPESIAASTTSASSYGGLPGSGSRKRATGSPIHQSGAAVHSSKRGEPWTRRVLELIDARPETVAEDLAASLGMEKLPFKRDVRKLKELGLTESLLVGYRLSPRGRAYLAGYSS